MATTTSTNLFTVTSKNGESFSVRAKSYECAADIACRKLNGRRRGLIARRTTGDAGLSGYFQGYYPDRRLGCLNSIGQPFHVS